MEDEGEEEGSRGGVDIRVKRNLFIPSTAKIRSTISPAKRPLGEAIKSGGAAVAVVTSTRGGSVKGVRTQTPTKKGGARARRAAKFARGTDERTRVRGELASKASARTAEQ